MHIKTTLSISNARKKLFSIADDVQEPSVYYTLTDRGRPKVVLIGAEQFEALVHTQNIQTVHALSQQKMKDQGWIVREAPRQVYGEGENTSLQGNDIFILREAPKVLYVDRKVAGDLYQAKELAKAQLYIELIEKYQYPLYLVEIGRCVKIGGDESRRYIETDIMISGNTNNILLLFSVAAMAVYDESKEGALKELFELATTLAIGTGLQTYLVYYSRMYEKPVVQRRCLVIAFHETPSYEAWKHAGEPTRSEIPKYSSFLKKKRV